MKERYGIVKKWIALILALVMLLGLVACGGENKKAFDLSKKAFEEVEEAYSIAEQFGDDIHEAWRMAIYDKDEILKDGVKYLAKKLNLTESELADGVAARTLEIGGVDWDTATEEDKDLCRNNSAAVFRVFEDDLFSFVVMCVSSAYRVSGKTDIIQASLDAAKTDMKEMSEKYSDYEHYASLKKYYTTTSAFFEFCNNPTGSFEVMKTTISNYKDDARTYRNDLTYIFED